MAGKIIIPILSAFSAKGVNDAKSALGGLKGALGDVGKSIAGGFAGGGLAMGAGDFMDTAISQARDLQRNMAAVNTVFDEQTDKIKSFISTSQNMGMSNVDAAQSSVFLGSVLKQSGFSMDEVATQTEKLTSLAADLAITYGKDVSEALTGMTAMFRGEYDPIEKFGVAIKQQQVNALVAAKGLSHLTGVEKLHAQQVAKLELFYAATADAQGAFSRQSESLFAQQTKLTAGFNNMASVLGEPLLAPLAHMASMFGSTLDDIQGGWMPAFEAIGAIIEATAPIVKILGEVFAELGMTFTIIFQFIADAIDGVMPIFLGLWAALKPVIKAVNAVLSVLNTIIKAIMIPIKVIGLLIGIMLKVLGDFFDWLLGGVMGAALGGIGDAFGAMNGDLDTVNASLDDMIAKIFKLENDPPPSNLFNPRYRAEHYTKGPAELTEEQKKFIESMKTFKKELRDVLKGALPGALATRELGDFEKSVVDAFKSIFTKINDAYAAGLMNGQARSAMIKYGQSVQKQLQGIASERDKLAERLDLGKALIANTKKSVQDFASLSNIMSAVGNTVTKSVSFMVGAFKVTTTETVAGVANATTIINKFKDIVSKTKDFQTDLQKLRKMGLTGDLYTQILGLGLDQGGAMAKSILEGGQTAVTTLNGLQTEINTLGANMGEAAAQVMYGAGLNLTDGLVKGILAADNSLKTAAETLAKTFQTAFDAAIGTKYLKSFTAPYVDPEYAKKAIEAYKTPATTSPDMSGVSSADNMPGFGGYTFGVGGVPTQITINVAAGIVTDPIKTGQTIVEYVNKYAKTQATDVFYRGGNY